MRTSVSINDPHYESSLAAMPIAGDRYTYAHRAYIESQMTRIEISGDLTEEGDFLPEDVSYTDVSGNYHTINNGWLREIICDHFGYAELAEMAERQLDEDEAIDRMEKWMDDRFERRTA